MRADHEAWGTALRDKAAGLDLSPGRLRRLADLLGGQVCESFRLVLGCH